MHITVKHSLTLQVVQKKREAIEISVKIEIGIYKIVHRSRHTQDNGAN